jgi:hypothetical protein
VTTNASMELVIEPCSVNARTANPESYAERAAMPRQRVGKTEEEASEPVGGQELSTAGNGRFLVKSYRMAS